MIGIKLHPLVIINVIPGNPAFFDREQRKCENKVINTNIISLKGECMRFEVEPTRPMT